MSTWSTPHISKIYEALTAIADNRITLINGGNEARCYSSSKGKFYNVVYDPNTNSIMSDDNTAYYTGAVSYPMIALLMLKGVINYDNSLLSPLSNIVWKDIMTKYKNDYDKGITHVLKDLEKAGHDIKPIKSKIERIYQQAIRIRLKTLGRKLRPPKAY
ncbi:MAG: hypothetical protein WCL07_02885 [bacterium]